MTHVWLPYDDWATRISVPDGCDVDVYHSGLDLPATQGEVEFYVPEYMGPKEAFTVIAALPALRVVQSLTAGVDHLAGLVPDHVVLCNARGVHDAATAELALGLTIAALRGVPQFVRAQDQGLWRHERRLSLADRHVMLLGLGSVGRAVRERLRGFEVEICAVARTARTERDGTTVHSVDELPALVPTVDVIIVTLPLDRSTLGLVDETFLASMRDGALLVNVARGAVVDTDALLVELRSGRLAAALDVTDPEPLPAGHPLWRAPNLLITPHVGGDSSAYLPRAARLISDQLARYSAGAPLANVVRA